jgi:S1-C subfamily serine protease
MIVFTGTATAQGEVGERVYQRLLKSTVWVVSPLSERVVSTGSGSLVDGRKRLVLTNYHVVGSRDAVMVIFPHFHKNGGRPEPIAERDYYMDLLKKHIGINGKVVARSQEHDLALVQLDRLPEGVQALPLAHDGVSPGQRVHSMGNPGLSGALWVYTSGTVRQVYRKHWKARSSDGIMDINSRVIETQSPTNQGDSGGPLVNDKVELVGVTQGGTSNAQLLSTFIEVSEVRALLKSIGVRAPESTPAVAVAEPEKASQEPPSDAAKAEKDASRKLKLAKMLADDGLVDKAKARYQEIVEIFPNTRAAEEARHLLEKLDK